MTKKISRHLGDSGLETSPMGLGLAALGRPGYINLGHGEDLAGETGAEAMERAAGALMERARELGVRYFDTARSYGLGERFLATWLNSPKPGSDRLTVASKWGYTYTADWRADATVHEVKDHTLGQLQKQWRESRAELGSHLDLYQIHSATLESGVLNDIAVLTELAQIKADGTAIGLSVSGPRQGEVITQARSINVDGVRLFDTVQATWNLLETSAGGALADAHSAGMGVIIKEGLANGRLTDRNHDPGFSDTLGRLEREAARLECTVDALALAAIVSRPWVDVVLSGASLIDQLESNLRALDVDWDARAERALAQLNEAPRTYWAIRGGLSWQ